MFYAKNHKSYLHNVTISMYGGGVILRDYVIGNSINIIKKQNPNYSDERLEELKYGLSIIYILVTKSIIIFSIAYFLSLFKELFIFMIIYSLVKRYSYGMHMPSSFSCLIASSIVFLGSCFIAKEFILPMGFKTIFGLFSVIYMYTYSPADTEKKPIINPKLRRSLEIKSTLIASIVYICSLVISNSFIADSCTLALFIQCVMISPISYRLTNQKYDNYKNYHL